MRRQFAVFDIDGTIVRNSLLQLMTRELVARGKLGIGPGRDVEVMLHDFRQRVPDEEFGDYMKKALGILFDSLPEGLRVDDYDEIINAVVKTSVAHTYVYTRQLVQTLKLNHFFLIAISGSEMHAVEALSKALGFDAWVGSVVYPKADGRLTGEVKSIGRSKSDILKELITKFDLNTKGSTAVGDTSSDVDVLKMVESPIAFNPNQSLFTIARAEGWMIVLERKDMVYRLEKENGEYILKQTNA